MQRVLSTLSRISFYLLLSPTRLAIDIFKRSNRDRAAAIILKWNYVFFCLELGISTILVTITLLFPTLHIPDFVKIMILFVSFSRCNEISYAFLRDAIRGLDGIDPTTSLTGGQRIKMAMRSYIGLIVNFATIYYFLPKHFFEPKFENFVDALYFSGTTISTLGYGDIAPSHDLTKLLSLYEVLSGLLLIVIALAFYFSTRMETKS